MDKYKVETIEYEHNWIDVGPGPAERGSISHMRSMVRNYNKTYSTPKEALEELTRLQNLRWSPDIIIVSKLEEREYVPGKITVLTSGEVAWSPLPEYVWKRNPHTRINFFDLVTKRGESHVVSQSWFFKREPTFLELMKSAEKLFNTEKLAEMMLSRFQPLLPRLAAKGGEQWEI